MLTPKRRSSKNKASKTSSKTPTKTTVKSTKVVDAPVKPLGVAVDCVKLEKALLLFAFHESEKANYLIRMAQSGANASPTAAAQRISGLKTYYNSRLDAMKSIYDNITSSSAKTKKIAPEIDNALTTYYTGNTNSKVPEGYNWPVDV